MYYTHHFAHHETLRRACDWLDRFGFHPDSHRNQSTGAPRVSLLIASAQLAEVELLVNAAECADPHGWPSFWDEARGVEVASPLGRHPAAEAHVGAHRDVIGWHPIDGGHDLAGADLDEIREAMGH